MEDRVENIDKIAQKMAVAEETVRRWIRDNKLEGEDLGGRIGYRVTMQSFEKFLNSRTWSNKIGTNYTISGGVVAGLTLGAAVGGVLGGVVGGVVEHVIKQAVDSKNKVSSEELKQQQIKLEARKYELEQTKIALTAQIQSIDAELKMIDKLQLGNKE